MPGGKYMAIQYDASFIKEQFEALLADAVVRVKTEEDPLILNEYKKLFKQNVPLSLRSYVAAYLAKGIVSGGISVPPKRNKSTAKEKAGHFDKASRKGGHSDSAIKGKRDRPEQGQKKEKDNSPSLRVIIDDDKAASIFISVGRNRGVYARDIIGLVVQRASIERERIGDIRILDNYSFVQVYLEDADNAIALLNGTEYRHRKLTVSYAHKKDEDANDANANEDSETEN